MCTEKLAVARERFVAQGECVPGVLVLWYAEGKGISQERTV